MIHLDRCYREAGIHSDECRCYGLKFTTFEKVLSVVIAVLLVISFVSQIYKAGQREGFEQCQSQF